MPLSLPTSTSTSTRSRSTTLAARPGVRDVVRSALRSAQHSPTNRRHARELAWEWVSAKWPRLMPSVTEMDNANYERSLPGQQLSVSTSEDGAVWTLAIAHNERGGTRT